MAQPYSIARLSEAVPRYTSYPTAPHFHAGVGSATFREWLTKLRVKRDKAISAWMDLAPNPLTLQQKEVQDAIRASFQELFDTRVHEALVTLRQQEPNTPEEDLRRRAEAQVEGAMLPTFQENLKERNNELLNQHREGFPYNEFTFALVTMVLADLPADKMEKFLFYRKPLRVSPRRVSGKPGKTRHLTRHFPDKPAQSTEQ